MFSLKEPAHHGFSADKIEWKKPSKEEITILNDCLGYMSIGSFQKKVVNNPTKFIGYYRSTGKENLFIKIFSESNFLNQNIAEKISLWLNNSGINTIILKKGYPKKIPTHNLWAYVYDYVDSYFYNGSAQSLFALGGLLGEMHKLFQTYPSLDAAYDKGMQNNEILFEQFTKIKSNKVNLSFSKNALEIIKETSDSEYNLLNIGAQMIHGDLNYGNVIFNKINDQPIILDFENSMSTWVSPLYDLAFVIQRFILLRHNKNNYKLAAEFIDSYKLQNNSFIINSSDELFNVTKMISIRCLLILSTLPKTKQKLFTNEINKFCNLYKITIKNHSFYSKLSTLIQES